MPLPSFNHVSLGCMLVFLIGFMGAGKTTLGSALAKELGWNFVDLDREIERHSGCSVPELFARSEEPGFRKIEQEVLYDVVRRFQDPVSEIKDGVIACGGGTPCFKQNLAFMKENGFVVYLEVAPDILCERILNAPANVRPLIPAGNPAQLLEYIREMLAQRSSCYGAAHWKC